MAELTQYQVDRAVKAMDAYTPTVITNMELSHMVRAAAPFLQLPWDEPTVDEAERLHNHNARTTPAYMGTFQAIGQFVRGRNAAMINPVDPRREKIAEVLRSSQGIVSNFRNAPEVLADLILDSIRRYESYSDDHVG